MPFVDHFPREAPGVPHLWRFSIQAKINYYTQYIYICKYNIYVNRIIFIFYQSFSLPIYQSICLHCLSVCLCIHLCIYLSIYLPICLPIYLSTCLSIHPSTILFCSIPFHSILPFSRHRQHACSAHCQHQRRIAMTSWKTAVRQGMMTMALEVSKNSMGLSNGLLILFLKIIFKMVIFSGWPECSKPPHPVKTIGLAR